MKKWQIKFSGKLINAKNLKKNFETIGEDERINNLESINADFDLEWQNYGKFFDIIIFLNLIKFFLI